MGAPHYTVALQKIAAEQGLTVLHAAQDYATREIRTADVNRPGLQLAGFYNYFDPERMQIIGRVESTYLETLTPDQRRERFEQFMRYNIIGLVICHGMDPFPECLEMAEKYDRNLFLVRKDTSEFMADLIAALSSYLAPRLTQHGVLVEVFGEGVKHWHILYQPQPDDMYWHPAFPSSYKRFPHPKHTAFLFTSFI